MPAFATMIHVFFVLGLMVDMFVYGYMYRVWFIDMYGIVFLNLYFVWFLNVDGHQLFYMNRDFLLNLLRHQLVDGNSNWVGNINGDGVRLWYGYFNNLWNWDTYWVWNRDTYFLHDMDWHSFGMLNVLGGILMIFYGTATIAAAARMPSLVASFIVVPTSEVIAACAATTKVMAFTLCISCICRT